MSDVYNGRGRQVDIGKKYIRTVHRVSFFANTLPDRECEERDGMIDNK